MTFLLLASISLAQKKEEPASWQLDSMRQVVLSPKLKLYDQRVEKFTSLISATSDKKRIKEYAHQLAQVSDAFQDDIATLFDCSYGPGGGVYMGMGMGPWGFYPGVGGYMYSYPYNTYTQGGTFDCLPAVYYEVDRVKRYANNMRLMTSQRNVRKKLEFIRNKMDLLKKIESEKPPVAHELSVK
jgi:hypothetical protein